MLRRLGAAILVAACVNASAQAPGQTEKRNMELVAYHDLQGRGAYQPLVHAQGGRWIAYIGLHGGSARNAISGKQEANGTAILDVSDPRSPKWLAHIPGAPGAGAQMVRVCDGSELPRADKNSVYLLRTFGNSAQEVWNVADPARPTLVSTVARGLRGTHKNWWECDSGIAYLVSGVPGWRTSRMTQIFDLGNPAKPVFVRNFGLPGQQPGARGPVPTELHGPISTGPKGKRVYFAHGTSSHGVLQIVDRDKLLNGPKAPTSENLLFPQIGRLDFGPDAGAHTAFPVLDDDRARARDFVVVTSESLAEACREPRQKAWMVDVSDEARPRLLANWGAEEASGDFCRRSGRFGTHSSNESFTPIYYRRIMFFAHFNAGVRAVDIRDPGHPKEIGYYIPAPGGSAATYTNNVEVDGRGYIYSVDRLGGGMHILELSGPARAIAAFGQP
ncbi:MAG: hypothetical protein IH604_19720 [Burkholderiales bacterium]|nr:hypothetical protein [Burkholderiales bacterium]